MDAFGDRAFLIDYGSDQFRRIDVPAAHLQKMGMSVLKENIHNLGGIIDLSHGGDRIGSVMGTNDQRLRFIIRDTADTEIPFHLYDVFFEFRPEICRLYIMDGTVEAALAVVNRHAGTPCSQVRMIIRSIIQIKDTVTS